MPPETASDGLRIVTIKHGQQNHSLQTLTGIHPYPNRVINKSLFWHWERIYYQLSWRSHLCYILYSIGIIGFSQRQPI